MLLEAFDTRSTAIMTTGLSVSARKDLISPRGALYSSGNGPALSNFISGIADNLTHVPTATSLAVQPEEGEITCWMLDTRDLWPGTSIWTAPGAAEALALISVPEQKNVTTKMFIQDARMSLGSALIKRLFISQTLDIAWKDVHLGSKGGIKGNKPCAVDSLGRPIEGIDFNVSHQAGLVTLIGWNGKKQHKYSPNGGVIGVKHPSYEYEPDVMVGTDIVYVNERNDYRVIDSQGLDAWVDMYDYVFGDEERWSMIHDVDYVTLRDGTTLTREELGRHDRHTERHNIIALNTAAGKTVTFPSDRIVEAKLRRFYTYFCYKESYIKLAGEALLAPWLKQLEFQNVRSPKPGCPKAAAAKAAAAKAAAPQPVKFNPGRLGRCSNHGTWGEEVDDVEVHLHGTQVSDVRMKIHAYEENFMISTAVQGQIDNLAVPAFHRLNLKAEVMDYAHRHLSVAPSELM